MADSQTASDHGLVKNSLFIILYNVGLALFCLAFCKRLFLQTILVILFQACLILMRRRIFSLGLAGSFLAHSLGLAAFMWFNYEIIGAIDASLGGLPLYDMALLEFDFQLFQTPVAVFFEEWLALGAGLKRATYDLFMVSYMVYYLLPFIGLLVLFHRSESERREILGEYVSSFVFLFAILFTFYLLVPVTGPQYFLKGLYAHPLPMGPIGFFFHNMISSLHPTFIDCFPSGHAGVAILFFYWAYNLNFPLKHLLGVICALIVLSTLVLRFHYTLDVVGSFPLVLCSRILSKWYFSGPSPQNLGAQF